MKEVSYERKYSKKIAFYTLVTRMEEYREMVESAKNSGFDREDIEFNYFDNKKNNTFDGFSGFNFAIKNTDAEYLIFCHQDIIFKYDDFKKLEVCLNELEDLDPLWVLAGNAGANEFGDVFIKIIDPNGFHDQGPLPQKVKCLDENFIIINMKRNISCSYNLSGFHLYGLDICQNADYLGLNSYVINFLIEHKSAGKVDITFHNGFKKYMELQRERKSMRLYTTLCATKFVTSSSFLNIFLNIRLVRKIFIYLIKLNKA
ncbi:hypothetical protein [Acinetobacter populi]|nr:hypothetical protein [Acinetobacter populi]